MTAQFFKSALETLRRYLWQLLGVARSKVTWVFRHEYLSTADWVERGPHSYDNGALVWRWSKHERLIIGKYCSIAFGVQFLCGDGHHQNDAVSTFPLLRHMFEPNEMITLDGISRTRFEWDEKKAISKGPIVIGNDVWIGQNAIVLSGITIGHGAVVLAGSIVTKNIEPYAVVGGMPARFIKYRFEPHIIQCLLRIAWWDWPELLIKERIADFYDINAFVEKHASVGKPISLSDTTIE